MTEIMAMTIMNLVTSKAGAKHELLFNKSAECVQNILIKDHIRNISISS